MQRSSSIRCLSAVTGRDSCTDDNIPAAIRRNDIGQTPPASQKSAGQSKTKRECPQNAAKRLSCVLGMLSSLEVKVLRPT